MSYKEFAKEAIVIGLAQVLTGLANFLILPLITKTLGVEDYGIWIQISVTVLLLTQVVLLEQQMALIRFLSSKTDKKEIRDEFFTLFSFVAITGFGVALIVMAIAHEATALGLFQDGRMTQPFMVAALIIPFSAFGALSTAYFMTVRRFKTFAALTVFSSFGQLIVMLVLLAQGYGLMGVIIGSLVMNIVTFVIAISLVISHIGICLPKFHLLKPNLKFALPLTPSSLISWVTDSSDRYFVAFILGLSLAGIYSAAYGIGSVVFLVITPIQIVLFPTLSRLYDNNELDEVRSYLSKSLRYFLMLAIPAVAGLSALAEPLLVALTTSDFAAGSPIIPFVAMAGLFSGILSILTTILYLVKKTHLNLAIYTIPALANVLLVIFLTPILGIVGTAFATTLAYAAMLLLGAFLSFKYIRFPADWSFIVKSVASAALMVGVILVLNPQEMIQILLSIGVGLLVYFGSLIITRGITGEEIHLVRSTTYQIYRTIRGKRTGLSDAGDQDVEGPLMRSDKDDSGP